MTAVIDLHMDSVCVITSQNVGKMLDKQNSHRSLLVLPNVLEYAVYQNF